LALRSEGPLGQRTEFKWATKDNPAPDSVHGSVIDMQFVPGVDALLLYRIDSLGNKTEFKYDKLGNTIQEKVLLSTGTAEYPLQKVVGKDGLPLAKQEIVTKYTYDPLFSKMTSRTDPEENTNYFVIDSSASSFTPPSNFDGRQVSLTGRNTGNQLAVVDGNGFTTQFVYAAGSQVGEKRMYDGAFGPGDLLRVVDARGIKSTEFKSYDRYGNPTKMLDAVGNEVHQTFDPRSRNTLVENYSKGMAHRLSHTETVFDSLDRKFKETVVVDLYNSPIRETIYKYNDKNQLEELKNGLGHITHMTYEPNSNRVQTKREVQVLQADGTSHDIVSQFKYDANNNLVQKSEFRDVGTPWSTAKPPIIDEYEYDALNRRTLTRIIQGPSSGSLGIDGVISATTYDPIGNVRSTTNLNGKLTKNNFDSLYRVVDVELPIPNDPRSSTGNAHLTFQYDLIGHKLAETDSNQNTVTYVYDAGYRLTQTSDKENNYVIRKYDPANHVVSETKRYGNPTGIITAQTIYDDGNVIADGLGRPTSIKNRIDDSKFATTVFSYLDAENVVEITDPRQSTTRRELDGLGRVHRQIVDIRHQGISTPPLSLTTNFSYDPFGNVFQVKDPEGDGFDVTNQYDGLNRLIKVTYLKTADDAPPTEKYFYDGVGNLINFMDKAGVETRTTYDSLGRVASKTLIESISNSNNELTFSTWNYDDATIQTIQTDANGNPTTTLFDALGRVKSVEDAKGNTVETAFDAAGNLLQKKDANGNQVKYSYDAINRLDNTLEFDKDGAQKSETKIKYVDSANRVEVTDRNGVVRIEEKDMLGRALRISRNHSSLGSDYVTGAFGVLLQSFEYDDNGNVVNSYDANLNRTEFEYDGANRKVKMIEGADDSVSRGTTQYSYDGVGNLKTVKDGRSSGAQFDLVNEYDARYRLTKATNGENQTAQYSYDARDNMIERIDAKGGQHLTRYRYDELDRLLSVDESERGGGVTLYLYDANRNKIAQQDANGNLVTYRYNSLNQLTDSWQYLVKGNLNIDSVRGDDPKGESIVGNPFVNNGRLATPLNGDIQTGGTFTSAGNGGAIHWQFGYDDNGNQNLVVDPLGQVTDREYDWLDRVQLESYSHIASPSLDNQRLSIEYTYDGNSNLDLVKEFKSFAGIPLDEPQLTDYEYDKLDRLKSVTNFDGKVITYRYDQQGNRTAVVDPDQLATTYTYDARNRLKTATTDRTDPLQTAFSATNTTTYAYWENSLLKLVTQPNGVTEHYDQSGSYDRANRLKRVVTNDKFGALISSFSYQYDENGNRDSQTETHRDVANGSPQTTTYHYDPQNRLRDVSYASGSTIAYGYDLIGNRLSEIGTDPVDPTKPINRSYAYDRLNRLWSVTNTVDPDQSVAYDYDANGNRTARYVGRVLTNQDGNRNPIVTIAQVTSYVPLEYNNSDEMVRTTDGAGVDVKFDYSYDGMRIKKITSQSETRYLYDDGATLVEYDGRSPTLSTTARYNYGYDLLSRTVVNPNATDTRAHEFFVRDGLGSTSELTNEAGQIQVTYQYDAWGNAINTVGSSANPKQFTGHEYDPETGLIYARARYYDSTTGTFLTQDSYTGQDNLPPSLHRYAYAHSNPLRYVDPTGHASSESNNFFSVGTLLASKSEFDKRAIAAYDNFDAGKMIDEKKAEMIDHYDAYKKQLGGDGFGADLGAMILLVGEVTGASKIAEGVYAEKYRFGKDGTTYYSSLDTRERLNSVGEGLIEVGMNVMTAVDITRIGVAGARFAAGSAESLAGVAARLAEGAEVRAGTAFRSVDIGATRSMSAAERRSIEFVQDVGCGTTSRSVEAGTGVWIEELCFIAGTKVLTLPRAESKSAPTHRWEKRSIENIKPGDYVLARCEYSGELAWKCVDETFHRQSTHLRRLRLRTADKGDLEIFTTNEHPFWVHQLGWEKAENLKSGYELFNLNGKVTSVSENEHIQLSVETDVFNLKISDFANYFVSQDEFDSHGIWVHNANYKPISSSGSGIVPANYGLRTIAEDSHLQSLWEVAMKDAASAKYGPNGFTRLQEAVWSGLEVTPRLNRDAFNAVRSRFQNLMVNEGLLIPGDYFELHHWNNRLADFPTQALDPRNLVGIMDKDLHRLVHRSVSSNPAAWNPTAYRIAPQHEIIIPDSEEYFKRLVSGEQPPKFWGTSVSTIQNGTFTITDPSILQFGWQINGSGAVDGELGVLGENTDQFGRFRQSFTIPAGTTALRFTVTGADFKSNGTMVPDAFEAAVVNSVTGASLVSPMAGLGNSDAVFNLQTDGHAFFSPQVTVTGVANSGDTADVDQPIVVTVDLKNVPAGTPATVYFDLLGFGPIGSTVTIDNVQLLGPEGNHAPVPGPFENYTMLQNQKLIRTAANGLLANDTDEENDPLKALLTASPAHGTLKFFSDGSFEYTPDQNYVGQDTFQYRISDGELLSGPVTVTFTIESTSTINTPPVIVSADLSLSPQSIHEGEATTLNAKFTDPDTEPHTVHINWGDGSTPTVINLAAGVASIPATQHVYRNNPSNGSTFPITVTVSDAAANAAASTSITVLNSAPTVVLAGATAANEGQTVRYTFTATDPGKDGISVTTTSGGAVGAVSNVLFDNATGLGSFDVLFSDGAASTQVNISVKDAEGATSQLATLDVSVNNVAPQATIGNNGPVNEGSPAIVSLTNASDVSSVDSAAGLHYSFATTIGDLKSSYAAAVDGSSKTFTFEDNGSYTIYGRVFDKDGGFTDYESIVVVNNVAPQATIGNNGPVNEGSPTIVSLTNLLDVSAVDSAAGLHYSFATTIGDLKSSYAAAMDGSSKTFTFTDNGSYTVYGRVFDKDGGFTDYNTIIVVNNVAPTAVMSNNGPVNAGLPVTVSLTGPVDPSIEDRTALFRYSFATNPSGLAGSYLAASAFNTSTFTFATAGNQTIYGRIFDKDGGSTDYSTTVVINPANAVDVTSLVTFRYYGAQYNARTRIYSFYGTVTNNSSQPIRGPIQLAWSNISPTTAQASGHSGIWTDGSPYFDLSGFVGSDGILQPGEMSQPRTFGVKVVSPGAYSFTTRVRGVLGTNGAGEGDIQLDPYAIAIPAPDFTPPVSHVATIADRFGSNTIQVAWGGADEAYGSGIESFDIYVARDSGPYSLWIQGTQELIADYFGENGHDYTFYSVGHDRAGNKEAFPAEADTATEILFWPKHNSVTGMDVNGDGLVTPLDALLVISNLTHNGSRSVLSESIGAPYFDTSADNVVSPLDVLKVIDYLSRNRGTGEGEFNVFSGMPVPMIGRRGEDDYFASMVEENGDFLTILQDSSSKISLKEWKDQEAAKKVVFHNTSARKEATKTSGRQVMEGDWNEIESILNEIAADLKRG
jgi:RHS repeat-associated protein